MNYKLRNDIFYKLKTYLDGSCFHRKFDADYREINPISNHVRELLDSVIEQDIDGLLCNLIEETK